METSGKELGKGKKFFFTCVLLCMVILIYGVAYDRIQFSIKKNLDPDMDYFFTAPYRINKASHVFENDFLTRGRIICTNRERNRSRTTQIDDYDAEILLVGASNCFGFRLSFEDTLQSKLENLTGKKVCNLSVVGYTSQTGLLRLKKNLNSGKWKNLEVAIISFGINDASYRTHSRPKFLAGVSYIGAYTAFKFGQLRHKITNRYLPNITLPEFKKNLGKIEQLCKDYDIQPLFLTDPVAFHKEIARNSNVTKEFFKHTFPHTSTWKDYCRQIVPVVKNLGMEKYFPIVPSLYHLEYLKYEQYLLSQTETPVIDSNCILAEYPYYKTFLRDGVTYDGIRLEYIDHCHLSGFGWDVLAPAIAEKVTQTLANSGETGVRK